MANAPSRGAGSSDSPPRNLPIGGGAAEKMNASIGRAPVGSRRGEDVIDRQAGGVGENVPVHAGRVVEHGDGQLSVEPQGAEEVERPLLFEQPLGVDDP